MGEYLLPNRRGTVFAPPSYLWAGQRHAISAAYDVELGTLAPVQLLALFHIPPAGCAQVAVFVVILVAFVVGRRWRPGLRPGLVAGWRIIIH